MFMKGFARHWRTIILIVCLIVIGSCSDDEPSKKIDVAELLPVINKLRAEGCQCGADLMPPAGALTWNDALQKAAEGHASDMYANIYFNHISPDGSSPISRAQQAGYEGEYVGENIARGYNRIEDVVNGWKESEGHCKAMMDTLYNEMGASEKGGYWVLDLGRSK
jgi:uncharacterized protein YkwD